MGLIERISTLIRANLSDLIEKAEDPKKMINQVILDMREQLVQVKTQIAVSIADLNLLEKKAAESEEQMQEWMGKAELAVSKNQDELARSALERYQSRKNVAERLRQQVSQQKTQVDEFKSGLLRLEQKLCEAEAKRDILIARLNRARAASKVSEAKVAIDERSSSETFERMKNKVDYDEALSLAKEELASKNPDAELEKMEKEDQVEALLRELKARRGADTA